jgi:hypothetical protein
MRRPRRRPAVSGPTVKISMWVGASDWQWLQTRHRNDASRVVRDLIADYVRKTRDVPRAVGEWSAHDLADL